MQNYVTAPHRFTNPVRITYVTSDDLEVPGNVLIGVIEPALTVERIVEHECAHCISFAYERFYKMRADEPISASD
jgi:hypothetical protein